MNTITNMQRMKIKIRSKKNGNLAFTLIEMLVVIAILATLISLIVPGVSRSIRRAQETQGMSNLRQIGQAAMMFALENRGHLPSDRLAQQRGEHHWTWLLHGYTHEANGIRPAVFADPSSGIRSRENHVQFVLNIFVAPLPNFNQRSFTLLEVPEPSLVIYAADGVVCPQNGWTHAATWNLGGNAGAIWSSPLSEWSVGSSANADRPIPTQDRLTAPGGDGDIAYRSNNNSAAKVLFLDGRVQIMPKGSILAKNIQPGHLFR